MFTALPHVREQGLQNPGNFCLWYPEYWALESGIQLQESGIQLTIGIQNPSYTDKECNPVIAIQNPRRGIPYPESKNVLDSVTATLYDY